MFKNPEIEVLKVELERVQKEIDILEKKVIVLDKQLYLSDYKFTSLKQNVSNIQEALKLLNDSIAKLELLQ